MSFVQKQLGGNGRFGYSLRELRELRGFTQEQLAERTKIHVSVIVALEEERLDDVTDPFYAERHVRALIQVLEGRPGYFLQRYRELVAEQRANEVARTTLRPTVRRRDFFVPSRLVAVFGFALLVLLAAGYLAWQTHLLQDPPPLLVTSPEDGLELRIPRVDVRGQTASNAIVTVNGKRAVVDRSGAFSLTFDVPRGLTTITIEARRRYGAPVQETRRVTYLHETDNEKSP